MQGSFPPGPYVAPVPPQATARRYSRIHALLLSFFSADLYRDVARRWRGIGFLYLVLLLAISFVPLAIKGQMGFSRFARNDAPAAMQGFPGITITKGVVSIDRPEPYLWKIPQTGEVILYVDTTNAFDLPEGANAMAKLGRSSLEVRQDQYNSRRTDLSQIQSFYLDRARVQGWLDIASKWIGVTILVGGLIGALIWHLIQILVYGLIGLLLCQMFLVRLDYPALLRLSAVAITPAILLDTALGIAGVDIPYSGFLFLAMEIGYLAFAVKTNREPTPPPIQGLPHPYLPLPPQI